MQLDSLSKTCFSHSQYGNKTMPKIDKLNILNYRGIREGKVEGLANVNIFVGRNGSGKSTILEAIYMLGHLFNSNSSKMFHEPNVREVKMGEILKKRNMVLQADEERSVGFSRGGNYILHFPVLPRDCWYGNHTDRDIVVEASMGESGVEGIQLSLSSDRQKSGVSFPPPHQHFSEASVRFLEGMVYIDARLTSLNHVEKHLWTRVAQMNAKPDIIRYFNAIYPLKITDINYTPDGLYVSPEGEKYGLLLDNLGSGMRIGIRLLLLLLSLNGTAILMEEFDAYEFPESLAGIAKLLMESAADRSFQFFLTTHRIESIRAFIDHYKAYPQIGGAVICTMLSKDGVLKNKTMDFPFAEKLIESGMDIRYLEDYE